MPSRARRAAGLGLPSRAAHREHLLLAARIVPAFCFSRSAARKSRTRARGPRRRLRPSAAVAPDPGSPHSHAWKAMRPSVRARCHGRRSRAPPRVTSSPSIRTLPLLAGVSPVIARSVVDLPAPWNRSANDSPSSTDSDTPFSASMPLVDVDLVDFQQRHDRSVLLSEVGLDHPRVGRTSAGALGDLLTVVHHVIRSDTPITTFMSCSMSRIERPRSLRSFS